MRKLMKMGSMALVASVLFTACSIEKRHYMPGYHVEWKTNTNSTSTATADEQTPTVRKQTAQTAVVEKHDVASVQTATSTEVTPATSETATNTSLTPSQKTFSPSVTTVTETKTSEGKTRNSIVKNVVKKHKQRKPNEPSKTVLILMCCIIPLHIFAVGIVTDWGEEVIWNLLWTLTIFGGAIHGIIVVLRNT